MTGYLLLGLNIVKESSSSNRPLTAYHLHLVASRRPTDPWSILGAYQQLPGVKPPALIIHFEHVKTAKKNQLSETEGA